MSKLPILIIIVIIIIVLISLTYQKHIFPSIIPSHTSKSNTITSSTTTIIQPITTTPLNTSVFVSEINIKRLYVGPKVSGNYLCNYFNTTRPYEYNKLMKGESNFNFTLTLTSTSYCKITFKNISTTTPNFEISKTNPILPYTLPGHNSQVSIQINVTAPFINFSGPLSITIYET